MQLRRQIVGLMLAGGLLVACKDEPKAVEPKEPAELIVVGGTILTLDRKYPEVEAIAIREGKVQEVGTREAIEKLKGSATEVYDLQGGFAVPGLTDAHAHLIGLGRNTEIVDLRGAKSIDEVVERLKSGAPKEGWVIGRGWDQNLWQGIPADPNGDPSDPASKAFKPMPTHHALTSAFPSRPVWLRRVNGHAGWANAFALQQAGVTKTSPDPEGGEILRDEEGEPTGVLIDNAMDMVPDPAPTDEEVRRWLLAAQDIVLPLGITGVHEMGVSEKADAAYRAMEAEGTWKLRVQGYADESWFDGGGKYKDSPDEISPDKRYLLTGVKVYVDGALGSRGAALLEPYADRPDHRGKLMKGKAHFEDVSIKALGGGWQVASHAIGDRGNRTILEAYAKALQRHQVKDHRLRVEHAQIVDVADIAAFADLRVIASMQPTHATSDMPWVPERIGPERLDGAYAWRRFIKAGVHLALGSDFPVERPDITHGLYAAITRQDAEGGPEGGWLPDQVLTIEEALAGFSKEAAWAARRDGHLGVLKAEYQADMTVFAKDLRTLSPLEVRDASVVGTMIAGELVWKAP